MYPNRLNDERLSATRSHSEWRPLTDRAQPARGNAARPTVHRSMSRTAGVIVAAFTAVTVAAACGDGGAAGGADANQTPAASGSPSAATAHNQADVAFAQGMIPHHEQAVRMAELAEGRAGDPEVTSLAAKIKAAQAPEIQQMTTWLTEWGVPAPSPSAAGADGAHGGTHGGGDPGGMPGMMTDQDMKALAAGHGGDFDRMFLEMMIRHHEGAVEMAETEEREGQHPGAKALAIRIKADQTAEIALMRDLLKRK